MTPHDEQREERGTAGRDPLPLDYFAASDPQRVASRGQTASAILLLLSWAPYLCGVVNAATSAASYVPSITTTHVNASILFLGVALVMALVSLVRFVIARHWFGVAVAGAVVLTQLTIAGCVGLG